MRFPGERRLHDAAIEVGDLRPSLENRHAEQLRMTRSREGGVAVVVDHDAVGAPQQHHRHRRGRDDVDGALEARTAKSSMRPDGR